MAVGIKIVEGDFVLNPAGTLDIVSGSDKCKRDFVKMLVTDAEFTGNETDNGDTTNSDNYVRYNPEYGTTLNNRNLYRGLSRSSLKDVLLLELNTSITNYLAIQEGRRNLSYGEIITSVDLDVYYSPEETQKVFIDISFTTAEGLTVTLNTFEQGLT